MTIFVAWQLRAKVDSLRNSCDVYWKLAHTACELRRVSDRRYFPSCVIYFAFLSLEIYIIYSLRQLSPVFNKVCVFAKFPNFLPFIACKNQHLKNSEYFAPSGVQREKSQKKKIIFSRQPSSASKRMLKIGKNTLTYFWSRQYSRFMNASTNMFGIFGFQQITLNRKKYFRMLLNIINFQCNHNKY